MVRIPEEEDLSRRDKHTQLFPHRVPASVMVPAPSPPAGSSTSLKCGPHQAPPLPKKPNIPKSKGIVACNQLILKVRKQAQRGRCLFRGDTDAQRQSQVRSPRVLTLV